MKSNWHFGHPGTWVKDFDRTVDYYENVLGIAGRVGVKLTPDGMKGSVRREFGRVAPQPDVTKGYKLDLLVFGDLVLEVLQLQPRRLSIPGEYLVPGEGINHVCFNAPDIEADSLRLCERGPRFMLVLRRKEDDNLLENYLDTRKYGNIVLSLRPDPDGSRSEGETAQKAKLATTNWKFRGHSVIVFDAESTAAYYEDLGLAAAQPEVVFDSSKIADFKEYGKTPEAVVKAKTRTAQIGPALFEFIQPVEGYGLYREAAAARAEGIFDMVFTVDDLEGEKANLIAKGVPVIQSGKPETGGEFACFDTRQDGGDIIIKLIQAQ